jgi:hypothetical protein
MQRLLRQNLIGRIKFSWHQVDVDTDAERRQYFIKTVDGTDGGGVFVFGQVSSAVH